MPKKIKKKPSRLPQVLIVVGVILIAIVMIALKEKPEPTVAGSSSALPEAQLNRALQAGKPALAFFHSNNCQQCIIMIDTVAQVFPEFAASVALVDVNVYDAQNEALLRKVKLQYIPMLVFYDQTGKETTHIGVLEPEALRLQLAKLSGAE